LVRVAARFTKTLYLVRYQQLIPPPDLVLSVSYSEQETSVAAQHNRLIAARHWNALRPFLTHLTPTPEVVCAERRFRQHRKPTVLHEKNAD
jgi:hypothetical protein